MIDGVRSQVSAPTFALKCSGLYQAYALLRIAEAMESLRIEVGGAEVEIEFDAILPALSEIAKAIAAGVPKGIEKK